MTGMTSRIIHSGWLPDLRSAFSTLRRFASFLRLASLVAARISMRSSSPSDATSISFSIARIASAPISARKPSGPCSSTALRYLVSVRSSCFCRVESFGSITT